MATDYSNSFEDMLLRSRTTVLEMLDARGYDVTPFSKITGEHLSKLITNEKALKIHVQHKTDKERSATVHYVIVDKIKQSATNGTLMDLLKGDAEDKKWQMESEKTEVIFLYKMGDSKTGDAANAENLDAYDKFAYEAYKNHGYKIQFFPIQRLVNNPLKHVLQPKFEVLQKDQEDAVMKHWYIREKGQLPIIKFHNDPVARFLGLLPGNIVKITRPSPTAGEYITYRVCMP